MSINEDTLPATYLINLKHAYDRRNLAVSRLTKLRLRFTIFDAVDGRKLQHVDYNYYNAQRRLRYFGRHLNSREVACLLSHLKIYKDILNNSLPHALVLEDDVVLNDNFSKILKELLTSEFPFDFIRFLCEEKIAKKKPRCIMTLSNGDSLVRLPIAPGGAHAYLVSLSGARKLLDYVESNGFSYPIDILIGRFWETGINSHAVNWIAYQDPTIESSIGSERFDKKIQLAGFGQIFYPFNRAWFKLNDLVRKRFVYWFFWWKDQRAIRKFSNSGDIL